jgi:hypothetical protein
MRTRLRAFLLVGGTAAAAMGLSVSSSLAATTPTWTVSPGGTFTARQATGKITITDTVTTKSVVCTTSTSAGSFETGAGLSGTGIGSFTSFSLTGCTAGKNVAYTATATGLPWSINAVKYIASKTTTDGTITGLGLTLSAAACSATIGGATAGSTGTVGMHFHNAPRNKLPFETTGANLHVYVTSGCARLFKNGDAVTMADAYVVNPGETITSP